MLLGIEAKYARPFTYRLARLNGEPAVVQYVGDRVFAATFCETDGERLTALYRVMNPEKLRLVE
jgi:RNA polymerase sigma-70 factor (ECF subfamily)